MKLNAPTSENICFIQIQRKNPKKLEEVTHPAVGFSKAWLAQSWFQKHLSVYLYAKLNFPHHIKEKVAKANKGIAVMEQLQTNLPWIILLTMSKFFIRPHLGYALIIHDQPNNNFFINKLERIQYITALAITGAIIETSRGNIYNQLGRESLKSRKRLHRLCTIHKIKTSSLPPYLSNLI